MTLKQMVQYLNNHKSFIKKNALHNKEMILSIIDKCSSDKYKISEKQAYWIQKVYYELTPRIDKLEKEQARRNSLSDFDRLWEDQSSYYVDTEVDWGSGRIEYITKERFKKIYDEMTQKIKKLENELLESERNLSGLSYWRR